MIRKQNCPMFDSLNLVYLQVMVHTRLQLELTVKIIITVDLMQRKYKVLTYDFRHKIHYSIIQSTPDEAAVSFTIIFIKQM